jgi:molybdopterin synthase sulfur carrier subunit
MLRVRVLYFAVLRELIGKSEEAVELDAEGATVASVLAILEDRHQCIRGKLGRIRAARNQKFADLRDALSDGDEIALIPPVAGG